MQAWFMQGIQLKIAILLGVALVPIAQGAPKFDPNASYTSTYDTPSERGKILDRHGNLLAGNRIAYDLTIISPDGAKTALEALQKCSPTKHPIRSRPSWLFHRATPKQSVVLQHSLTQKVATTARMQQLLQEHPSLALQVSRERLRHYPHAMATSHVTGRLGRRTPRDLAHLNQEQQRSYRVYRTIGRSGAEKEHEATLLGTPGKIERKYTLTTISIAETTKLAPVAGQVVTLAIDLPLQHASYKALQDVNSALIAIKPNTGEILAQVSTPSFDANAFIGGISYYQYTQLREDQRRPLLNRTKHTHYDLGSGQWLWPFFSVNNLRHFGLTADHPFAKRGATPMQLAQAIATLANQGLAVRLEPLHQTATGPSEKSNKHEHSHMWQRVTDILKKYSPENTVMMSYRHTSSAFCLEACEHHTILAYAPAENPQIAIALVVEHGQQPVMVNIESLVTSLMHNYLAQLSQPVSRTK